MMDETRDDAAVPVDGSQDGAAGADSAVAADPGSPSVVEVIITAEQYDFIAASSRASISLGVLSLVLSALLLGSVLYGHFVRGWRT